MCATPGYTKLGTNQIMRVIISRRMLMAGALELFNEHQHFDRLKVEIMDHTALITVDSLVPTPGIPKPASAGAH